MAMPRWAMLLGVSMLVAGCQPVVCEDTRPLLFKLLFGLPIPTLVTLVVALGLLSMIAEALGRERRARGGGLIVVLATSMPSLLGTLGLAGSVALVPVLLYVCLRAPGASHEDRSWTHVLTLGPAPSLGSRALAGVWLSVLLLVVFVGVIVTMWSVATNGQVCHERP